tara:strand:+ start:565 stop:714 length:150 start_codon:yes stop_codon:yes gene_type:complete
MALTEEQLDAIEAVKGKRNPALWDPRCQQYLENKNNPKTIKTVTKSDKG